MKICQWCESTPGKYCSKACERIGKILEKVPKEIRDNLSRQTDDEQRQRWLNWMVKGNHKDVRDD